MLGNLNVIKAVAGSHPEAVKAPGLHGIPLIQHAEAGSEDSKEVLAYLQSLD